MADSTVKVPELDQLAGTKFEQTPSVNSSVVEKTNIGESVKESPDSLKGQDEDVEPELHWRTWIVVAAACLNYAASTILLTSVGFWDSEVTATVGGASLKLWIAQACLVTSAILSPPFSRIGDLVGRRYIWLATTALGVLASALLAGSSNIGTSIVGSALFGVAFANSGNVFAAPAEVLPRRHRGTAALAVQIGGYCGTSTALLGGAGFILNNPGGYIGWRSIFWLGAAVHAATFILVAFTYFPPPPKNPLGLSLKERIFGFDIVGTILYTFAFMPLLMALIWGGNLYAWSSAHVVATLTLGLFFFVVFVVHQTFFKKDGLFHHGIFHDKNAGLCLFAIAVEGFVYITFNDYYGEETAVLYDARTFFLALRFAAFIFAAAVGSLFWMYIAYKFKRLNEQLTVGFVFFLAGVIGLATATPGSGKAVIAYAVICGFGFASPISCLFSVLQLCVDPIYVGTATGLLVSIRSVGGAVGTAICGAVFTSKINHSLPTKIASAALSNGLPASSIDQFVVAMAAGNATLAEQVPGVTVGILEAGAQAALEAYAYSFRYIWIVMAPFVAAALICCLCIKNVRPLMTFVVDAPVEEIKKKHRDNV